MTTCIRTLAGSLLAAAIAVASIPSHAGDGEVLEKIADDLGVSAAVADKLECGKSEYRDLAKWGGGIAAAAACLQWVCGPVAAGEATVLFASLGIPTAVCAAACGVAGGAIMSELADAVLPVRNCASAVVTDGKGAVSWGGDYESAGQATTGVLAHHRRETGRDGWLVGSQDRIKNRCQVGIRDSASLFFLGVGEDASEANVSAHTRCRSVSSNCSKPRVLFTRCNRWSS